MTALLHPGVLMLKKRRVVPAASKASPHQRVIIFVGENRA